MKESIFIAVLAWAIVLFGLYAFGIRAAHAQIERDKLLHRLRCKRQRARGEIEDDTFHVIY